MNIGKYSKWDAIINTAPESVNAAIESVSQVWMPTKWWSKLLGQLAYYNDT